MPVRLHRTQCLLLLPTRLRQLLEQGMGGEMTLFERYMELHPNRLREEFDYPVCPCPDELELGGAAVVPECSPDDTPEAEMCRRCWNKRWEEQNMNEKAYQVEITETLQRVVSIKASSEQEAIKKAHSSWNDGQIELTAEDFKGADFQIYQG